MKFPWRNQLQGFALGSHDLVASIHRQQQEEIEQEKAQQRVREQAADRTRNSLGIRSREPLSPAHKALAEAHERLINGEVGPVNAIEKTGGFSIDRSGRKPQCT